MASNTKHKDTVFSSLFSSPDALRGLYSAITGIALPADILVTVNTLQDVLYMDMVNKAVPKLQFLEQLLTPWRKLHFLFRCIIEN